MGRAKRAARRFGQRRPTSEARRGDLAAANSNQTRGSGIAEKDFSARRAWGYQSAIRPIDPAAGEEIIALSKWLPWMARAVDAQTKQPIPTFTVMNRMLRNLTTKFGPSTAQNGETRAGYFTEKYIQPWQLTIEAPGYETFRSLSCPCRAGSTFTS